LFSILIAIFAIIFLVSSLVKISPFQKAVMERLSKYKTTLEPGWHIIIPLIDYVQKVDMRERVINTPPQEMITQDNAVVTVDAVIFTQIYDSAKAVYEIQDAFLAISNLSITTLRAIIGTMTLDQVL
jgi:regulator of protease activity HflC (stomatin/prohibitin superfamily)